MNKGKRRLDDFTGMGVVIEDVKAMLTSWMIHEGDGNIAFTGEIYEFVNRLIQEISI